MNKKSIIMAIILTFVIATGIGISIVVSYQSFSRLREQNTELKSSFTNEITMLKTELTKKEETTDTEPEYVTIAGMYKIEDTSKISNAYINKDNSSLSEDDKETLKMASEVLAQIIKPEMSLYEKEVAVHDWMVTNIKYNSNSLVAIPNNKDGLHLPHGVLKKKKAVCVGYATTFKLFMNMLGIECKIVHSTDLSHSWDILKLDDGKWYLTDVTFDAGNNYISYANFNCPEETFIQGHQWNTDLYPKAEGRKYNYYVQNAKPITNIKTLPKIIKEAMKKKTTSLIYLLPKNVDESYIQKMSDGIGERVYYSMEYNTTYTMGENEQIIMAINIVYKDNAATADDYTELYNELDKYFGTSSY